MNALEFYSSLNVGDKFIDTRFPEVYEKVNEDFLIDTAKPDHQISVSFIFADDPFVKVGTAS